MSEHTTAAGPWNVEEFLFVKGTFAISDAHGVQFGKVQDEANARLIAAAPDLLDYCKKVVGFCVNARQTWPCWEEHSDVRILYALARTTLDKIEEAKK